MPPSRLPHPKSLYAETARPLPPPPELAGDLTAAVAIVGGGFTGLSSALHLAERGIDAVVREAHEPGWGASGRNGGQVNPGIYPDPDLVMAEFGPELGQKMLSFSGNAPNMVFDLVKKHAIACEAAQTGTLRMAFSEKKLAANRSTFEQLKRTGSPAQWVEKEEAARLTGTERYLGGRALSAGRQGQSAGLCAGTGRGGDEGGGESLRRLARFVDHPAGDKVEGDDAQWQRHRGRLVLATNAYTDDLWRS